MIAPLDNTVMPNVTAVERPDMMSKNLLEEMSAEAFERAMADFIAREQIEVLTSPFFQVLALIDQEREKQAVGQVVHLQTRVVDDRLVFVAPTEAESLVTVEDNEILLEDGRRIVLELVSD